jgi:hypothetical protein
MRLSVSYLEAWKISSGTYMCSILGSRGRIERCEETRKGRGEEDVFVNTSTLAWLYTKTRRNPN